MSATTTCDICQLADSKYKCPSIGCGTRYCSVKCYKAHKESSHPTIPQPNTDPPRPASTTSNHPTSLPPTHHLPPLIPPTPTQPTSISSSHLLKPQTNLIWPVVSETTETAYYDPLKKDEIKGLRTRDFERIVRSREVRRGLDVELDEAGSLGRLGLGLGSGGGRFGEGNGAAGLRDLLRVLRGYPRWKREEVLGRLLGVDRGVLAGPSKGGRKVRGAAATGMNGDTVGGGATSAGGGRGGGGEEGWYLPVFEDEDVTAKTGMGIGTGKRGVKRKAKGGAEKQSGGGVGERGVEDPGVREDGLEVGDGDDDGDQRHLEEKRSETTITTTTSAANMTRTTMPTIKPSPGSTQPGSISAIPPPEAPSRTPLKGIWIGPREVEVFRRFAGLIGGLVPEGLVDKEDGRGIDLDL